jgi:Ni,Fe-hydrogenase III large subunit/ssDNA-binding Zn-finger/Zn-ribbon topoisomerase 1
MTMLSGAREGGWTRLRHLTAWAAARDLATFVVPGLEIARAHGLDLAAAGLRPVATPRHAAVLLVVGELPDGLRRAAAVVWAQMPRPRAVLVLGVGGIDPLPGPDLAVPLRQEALATGVAELRRRFAVGAFSPTATDFDAAAVRTTTTYTCPMHPEIVRAEQGRCPICGMDLVAREEAGGMDHDRANDDTHGMEHQGQQQAAHTGGCQGYTCPMHPDVVQDGPGSCPICGMDLVPRGGDTRSGESQAGDKTPEGERGVYTCPMHPEIAADEPGSCPICGMDLVPRGETGEETGHDAPDDERGAGKGVYTCPMHPEVVRDEPGSCPVCGMDLVPREANTVGEQEGSGEEAAGDEVAGGQAGYTCPMHPEIARNGPGRCPICGMDLVPREAVGGGMEHGHAGVDAHGEPVAQRGEQHQGYACPMHPEVVQDGPGSCPLCGMDLVPQGRDTTGSEGAAEATAAAGEMGTYTCPMHPEIVRDMAGTCPVCGMDLVPYGATDTGHTGHDAHTGTRDGDQGDDEAAGQHVGHDDMLHPQQARHGDHVDHAPSGQQGEAGGTAHSGHDMSGMDQSDHSSHDMHGMDHGDHDMGGGFMSMVMMTQDLPRSADGLPMEWLDVPFGPLFSGLPGGLALTLTLDGDTVAEARATSATARGLEGSWPGSVAGLPDRLARLDPLAPVAYRLLAERALAAVADTAPAEASGRVQIGALERERVVSHLNWLAAFARLLGLPWLAAEATRRHRALRQAGDVGTVAREAARITALVRRVHRTPLLARSLRGVGAPRATAAPPCSGPVARAAGAATDARGDDPLYRALGFMPLTGEGDDAWARLALRLAEIAQSLDLVAAAGALDPPPFHLHVGAVGTGEATVETPRGAATLRVTVRGGAATAVTLTTPSMAQLAFVKPVAEGREVADALIGIASLDLSPWELGR